jgi:hypothetical protein
LCAHARLLREFVIAYLKGRLVDQFGLASGFASLSACGRLGLRRATLYHCAAKDDFPAPAAITAWHDFVSTTPPTMPAITSQILIMNAVSRAACSKSLRSDHCDAVAVQCASAPIRRGGGVHMVSAARGVADWSADDASHRLAPRSTSLRTTPQRTALQALDDDLKTKFERSIEIPIPSGRGLHHKRKIARINDAASDRLGWIEAPKWTSDLVRNLSHREIRQQEISLQRLLQTYSGLLESSQCRFHRSKNCRMKHFGSLDQSY